MPDRVDTTTQPVPLSAVGYPIGMSLDEAVEAAQGAAQSPLPPSEVETNPPAQVEPGSREDVSENGARTEPPSVGEGLQAAAAGDAPDPRVRAANAEAAGRRRQLREVEQERDQLRETVNGMHRAEVERLAADRLHDPSDLWASTDLDALRGEDGNVDAGTVQQAMAELIARKPYLAKPIEFPPFDGGVSQNAIPAPGPSIGQAMKDARRR